MMMFTSLPGLSSASPTIVPAAFVDADRDLAYDIGELQFATIQEAINAAPVGGQVVVLPGTHVEQITIAKSLSLVSNPAFATPILSCPASLTGDMAQAVLDGAGNRILVKGLIFEGPGPATGVYNGAMLVKNDSFADIEGNTFRFVYSPASPGNNQSFAISVGYSRPGGIWMSTAQARVYGNTFTQCYPGAVRVAGFGSVLEFDTNYVFGQVPTAAFDAIPNYGVQVIDEAQAVITYNNLYYSGTAAGSASILAFNGADVDINNNYMLGPGNPLDASVGMMLQGTGTIPTIGVGAMNLMNAVVDTNFVSAYETGVYVLMTRQDPMSLTSPISVTNNDINSNMVNGLKLEAVDNVTVSYNSITGNGLHGIWVSTMYADNLIQDNNVYGNDPTALSSSSGLHNFTPLDVVDAEYNYWGSPTGPGGVWLGTGDGVSPGVLYGMWYTAPVPGGSPISATGSQGIVNVVGSGTFDSVEASMSLDLQGSATVTATAMLFNGAPAQGMARPLPRYYHFRLDTVAGITQVNVHARYLTVPPIMSEDSLRLYYYDLDHWERFSSSYVDKANKTVVGTITSVGSMPLMSQLTGDFLIAIGQPSITLTPMQGAAGTEAIVRGSGFLPLSQVDVAFNGVVVGSTTADVAGIIPPLTFTAPSISPGIYEVRATDSEGSYALTTFNLLDVTPLVIDIGTSPDYYRYEVVDWVFTVSMGGVPIDADVLTVNLITPTGTLSLTSATVRTGTGTYRTPYYFDGAVGDYLLVIQARKGTTHQGDLARVFTDHGALPAGTIMSTLGTTQVTLVINWEYRVFSRAPLALALESVEGTVAMTQTVIGTVASLYTTIGAFPTSINGTAVAISSQVGSIVEAPGLVHANAISYHSGSVTVRTDIGDLDTSAASVSATVILVQGTTTTVETDLGRFFTTSASVNAVLNQVIGNSALVTTDLNSLVESAALVNATLSGVSGTTVTIVSDLNTISEAATMIGAQVTGVSGIDATVTSTRGMIVVPAADVSAAAVGMNGTNVFVSTSLNPITVDAAAINAEVSVIRDLNATILTLLNSFTVPATNISASLSQVVGSTASIDTSLGTVYEGVDLINLKAVQVVLNQTHLRSTVGSIWVHYLEAGAILRSVAGSNANIHTSYGDILEAASLIDCHIYSLENWTAVIDTSIGPVTQNVTTVNGHAAAFNATMAEVGSDIGAIWVPVSHISTRVTQLVGNDATVMTIFGSMPGTVTATEGKNATILTSIGSVILDVSAFRGGGTDMSALIIILAVIVVAIIILAFVVMTRRKT
jgi:hypothetical protein